MEPLLIGSGSFFACWAGDKKLVSKKIFLKKSAGVKLPKNNVTSGLDYFNFKRENTENTPVRGWCRDSWAVTHH